MCAFALFLGADPSLGRLDYSLLSDQALMEMLIDGFDDDTKKENQDSHGMYLDVCEWSCVECDDDERVIQIHTDGGDLSGSLDLCYVPQKVKVLDISPEDKCELTGSVNLTQLPEGMQSICLNNNELSGEIDLAHLPDGMDGISLEDNQLTGEIDLTHLPDGMRELHLGGNELTGEIDLTHLPKRMKELSLNNNQLSGEIDLTHLPDGMQRLILEENELTGEINLTQLPDEMEWLILNNNQLTGEIDLTHLPKGKEDLPVENNQPPSLLVRKNLPQKVKIIDVRDNHFNAIAVIDSKTDATIKLEGSGVTSVVDEGGEEVDMQRFLR